MPCLITKQNQIRMVLVRRMKIWNLFFTNRLINLINIRHSNFKMIIIQIIKILLLLISGINSSIHRNPLLKQKLDFSFYFLFVNFSSLFLNTFELNLVFQDKWLSLYNNNLFLIELNQILHFLTYITNPVWNSFTNSNFFSKWISLKE